MVEQLMRASDGDRQQVVERLRGALEEGRLSVAEFEDRMGAALQAVTYGDLALLSADLPAPRPVVTGPAVTGPVGASTSCLAGLPAVLKVLWTIWLVAVSVNVVVWVLVRDPGGHLGYPWPVWVAGPYGAVLFALSAAATLFRRHRPPVTRTR